MLAIIGGSGFENFSEFQTLKKLERETPFGLASSGLKRISVAGKEALFVSRHGEQHEDLPSEVNYRANIFALKKYGAQALVSFSAVGSLQKELKPGDLVVPDQFIDRTRGLRTRSFCGEGLVGHVSLADPTCLVMEKVLQSLSFDFPVHFKKTAVCIEGPAFSTRAEAAVHRSMGAELVGMTAFPEYALAREAGLPFLPCFFVTDYDCWDASIPHVTLEDVIKIMRGNNGKAFAVLTQLLEQGSFWSESQVPEQGLKTGLMTKMSQLSKEQRSFLEVLLS